MTYVPGMYFRSAAEANEWLEFDCSAEEAEAASYATSDQFEEWLQWRATY